MRATGELLNGNTRIAARSNSVSCRSFQKDLKQLWQGFIAFLAGNSEPKIQRVSEDNWRVYDPKTNRSLNFTSEQEVRVWLDERYSF